MEDSRFDDAEKAMVKTNLLGHGSFCYAVVLCPFATYVISLISRFLLIGQSVQASCVQYVVAYLR